MKQPIGYKGGNFVYIEQEAYTGVVDGNYADNENTTSTGLKPTHEHYYDIVDKKTNSGITPESVNKKEFVTIPVHNFPGNGGGSTDPVTIELTYDEASGNYKANYYAKDLVNMPISNLKFEVNDTIYPNEDGDGRISINVESESVYYNLYVSNYEQYTSSSTNEEDVWVRTGEV